MPNGWAAWGRRRWRAGRGADEAFHANGADPPMQAEAALRAMPGQATQRKLVEFDLREGAWLSFLSG